MAMKPVGVLLFIAACLRAQGIPASSLDFFENKIRPLLSTNCHSCHAKTQQMGGLRLDSAEAVQKGGSKGQVIVPGDPENSRLMRLVRESDAKFRMPLGGKLKESEIEDLASWIKSGAAWPAASASPPAEGAKSEPSAVVSPERKKFWSFQPLRDASPPPVKDAKWAKTDIDRFILAGLEKAGLKPVKPASKRDLIRRATLDLIGLPPTPEDIAAFEKDASPDAFAKVVDRLLASPHYGERWGRIWLDVARYGEDDYRSLNPFPRGYYVYPFAYQYRDWVIQAFNDDMPYNLFVKAQIAGDLLDEKIRHKMIPATGFLGLGPWYFDNGAVEVTRADERHDRVDAVTRGFLGLTVACARCHDHKYDPIPTKDYYALAGVFLNTSYHEYPLVPKSVVDSHKQVEDAIEKKQQMLGEMQSNLSSQLSQSLAFQTANYLQGVWEVTGPMKREKPQVVEARRLDYELLDRWIRYLEKPTDKYKYKQSWQAMMKRNGGNAQQAKTLAEEFQDNIIKVMLAKNALAEENEIIAAKALEGTQKKKRANKPNEFVTNDDFCPGCGLRLKNMPEDEMSFWTEIFQRELRENDDPNAMMAMMGRPPNPGVLMFRGWGLESRVGAESQQMMAKIREDIAEARKKIEPRFPFIHGVKDVEKPVDLPLSIRGDPFNLGDPVPRHFLSVLSGGEPPKFREGSGRLELAELILKQPISMRVIVNRIWKAHMGTGLVDSPSNFGMTGERPSNPDLLEYLASNFVRKDMSIKKLHRDIMLSAAYELSTDMDKAAYDKDADNRLYWRANRKRMDAEQVRDSILSVAGKLDEAMFGPSAELTPANLRRTIYGRVSRYKLDEYLQLFDFPSPNISAEKRFTTTVPTQRLFLMNSDFVQLQAEELAKRVAAEPDNRSRIRKVYQLAMGRDPSEQEIKLGIEYLRAEPMREYEEGKARQAETKKSAEPKPQPKKSAEAPPETPEIAEGASPMGQAMLAGMPGRRAPQPPGPPAAKYEPTAWGRYVKVLLSSSEFLFIN